MQYVWVVISPLVVLFLSTRITVAQQVGNCDPGRAEARLDINAVSATVYNTGSLFWRDESSEPHYRVPVGNSRNNIRVATAWIAGLVNDTLHATASTYGPWEMWPGPIEVNGDPPQNCSEHDRIFRVSRDDIRHLAETGIATTDIVDWPWQIGAPVLDGDGNPNNYDVPGGDRPDIEGDLTLWWVMNDAGNVHEWSKTPLLGIEVRVTAFASQSPTIAVNNSTFYRYTVTNRSEETIEDAYFGMWVDPDVGYAGDDYVGSDTTNGIAFAWNGDDFDVGGGGYGIRPPAIGFTVIEPTLSHLHDHGLTNFIVPRNDSSVVGTPQKGIDAYNYLRSRWRDGVPMSICSYGSCRPPFPQSPEKLMYSGRPPYFWSEEDGNGAGSASEPGERRFVWSSGPFTLPPNQSHEVVFAIVWLRGSDRFDSLYRLLDAAPVVKQAYRDGFGIGTSVQESEHPEPPFGLHPSFPNPFTTSTRIGYDLPISGRVNLSIVDILGRTVAVLVDGDQIAGHHSIRWHGAVSAGVYIARLETESGVATRKVTQGR